LRDVRNATFEKYITSLSPDDTSLWKATKGCKRPQVSIPPLRASDGSWAKSDFEKAAAFGDHLRQVFTPHSSFHPNNLVVSDSLDVPCPMSLHITPSFPAEVSAVIARLNVRKAPGYDLISGKVLQVLPPTAVVLLTTLYNSMLRLSYYPLLWTFAQIIMVPKPGKPAQDVASYRPISLLPIPAKVFAKILLKQLRSDVNLSHLIPG
jgi:hypothetical protein